MRRLWLVVVVAVVAAAAVFLISQQTKVWLPAFAFPPGASPEAALPARVYLGSLTLPTFKVEDFSYTPPPFAMDEVGRGYPHRRADRDLLRWDSRRAEDRTYTTVVLENEYLKLTMLPALGGRLFEAIFKPTGKQVFFRERRLAPYELYNCGKEWMFATGGLRFEFPTWGHDPNTEEPWEYELHTWPNGTASVTFSRTDLRTALVCRNHVSLDAGRSWIRLDLDLINPGDCPQEGAFWTITGLMGTSGIEFIMPSEFAIDHGGERTYRWPVAEGVDWAYFRNWPRMQAFFALDWKSDFSGLYDHGKGIGVVRWARPQDTPGIKLWGAPRSMNRYYVSLYGGLTQTMEEKVTFAPGEVRHWVELWYPLVGTRGLTRASREVALSLHTDDGKLVVGMIPTRTRDAATVHVARGDTVLLDKAVDLTPQRGRMETVDLAGAGGTLTVRITGADHRVLLEESVGINEIRPVFGAK